MQFDYMNEFIVFAHHLNMTNAASELHMAQSTLSKHIKQLEAAIGCPLICSRNGKTYLTKAGAHFMNCSTNILGTYNQLISECRNIDGAGSLPEITVQTPALTDRASEAYYRLIRHIRKNRPELQVRYLRASYKTIREGLRQGRVDLAIDYQYGSIDKLMEDYLMRGMHAQHLSTDELVVWCRTEHRLHRHGLRVEDLKDTPIMTTSSALSTMKSATQALCKAHGFEPLFVPVEAATQQEYLEAGLPNSVYLYPATFMDSPLIKSDESMAVVRFAEPAPTVHGFAVSLLRMKEKIQDTIAGYPSDSLADSNGNGKSE